MSNNMSSGDFMFDTVDSCLAFGGNGTAVDLMNISTPAVAYNAASVTTNNGPSATPTVNGVNNGQGMNA
jgi:hypothetical protein